MHLRRHLNEPRSARVHGCVPTEDRFIIELRSDTDALANMPDFDELFHSEHDRLYHALFFITGDSSEAEDLVQEAFLKLWERRDRLASLDDPVAYLFRVALNGFRTKLRRARTAARALVPVVEPRDPFDEIDLREDVAKLLGGLPQRQRAALVLTEIFDYGSDDAGRILGVKPTTVRVLASQGRAALRLEPRGGPA
jgi:RNA polymerase sigma-70 factor (ECF subfamily)